MDSREARVGECNTDGKYNFVDKVRSIPFLDSLVFVASESYQQVKENSALAGCVLGTAETWAARAYNGFGQTILDQLSGPLLAADACACKALEMLQSYSDVVRNPRQVLLGVPEFGRRKYNASKAHVGQLVQAGKALSAHALHSAAHPLDTALACLSLAGTFAERRLTAFESACDEYVASCQAVPNATTESCPRARIPVRVSRIARKAFACFSHLTWRRVQHVLDQADAFVAAVDHLAEEPEESTSSETTPADHTGAASQQVFKACAFLVGCCATCVLSVCSLTASALIPVFFFG